MKNIMRVLIFAVLFAGSEKVVAQVISATEAREVLAIEMNENFVQTIVRGKVEYPALARLARLEGKSLCKVFFDENGRVLRAELLESGNPILDKEALRVLTSETEFRGERAQKEVVVSVIFKMH